MMADYQLLEGGGVLRLSDGAFIPDDPENRDRREFDEWVAAGGKADPIEEPEPDPIEAEVEALRESARAKLAAIAELTPEEVAALYGGPSSAPLQQANPE